MKKTISLIFSLIIFAALCFCLYFFRSVDVYGHHYTLDAKVIEFDGSEIDNIENLAKSLKPFYSLKQVDLGTFEVDAKRASAFDSEFPGINLIYSTYVDMYGEHVPADTTDLDLSSKDIDDLDELVDALPYMDSLKSVNLGDNEIPHEEKEKAEAIKPDVKFGIISTYDMFGMTVRDDAESLDLRGITDTSDMIENLSLLKKLKSVDLKNTKLDIEFQNLLVKRFPEIQFSWDVDFDGRLFDSMCEQIDLTGAETVTVDLVRSALPLFPNLKRLDMSYCSATNEEMAELREEHPEIDVVWTLTMGKWSLKTDAVAFSVLIYDYTHTRLTSNDIEVLKYCTNLMALDLGHQAITDLSVIGEYLTELRVLILADNFVSNLWPLTNLKHLHYLELFVNWIYDVTPLGELKEIVDLNISYNPGISNISALLDLPLLERFWLESTNVSEEDVELLVKTYPNAKIVSEGEGSVDQGWRTHHRYYAMMDMWFNDYLSEYFSWYDNKADEE